MTTPEVAWDISYYKFLNPQTTVKAAMALCRYALERAMNEATEALEEAPSTPPTEAPERYTTEAGRWVESTTKRLLLPWQHDAMAVLGAMSHGIHNFPTKLKNAEFDPRYIKVNFPRMGMATYDFDRLTRLVIAAHDKLIRVELTPCNFQYTTMMLHPRWGRTGGMSQRHSSIDDAVEGFRITHGKPLEAREKPEGWV